MCQHLCFAVSEQTGERWGSYLGFIPALLGNMTLGLLELLPMQKSCNPAPRGLLFGVWVGVFCGLAVCNEVFCTPERLIWVMTSTTPSGETNPPFDLLSMSFSPSSSSPCKPHTVILARSRSCESCFISFPSFASSHPQWGQLEDAHLGTAGEQHPETFRSSPFIPQSSLAALPCHHFYFTAGSFSFSSRKLEFTHSLIFVRAQPGRQ